MDRANVRSRPFHHPDAPGIPVRDDCPILAWRLSRVDANGHELPRRDLDLVRLRGDRVMGYRARRATWLLFPGIARLRRQLEDGEARIIRAGLPDLLPDQALV